MTLLSKRLQRARLSRIRPYIRGDVLDLGCDNAAVKDICADTIDHYAGVERSDGVVGDLSRRFPEANFYQRDLDLDALDFGRQFDVILMAALIEHIFNQKHLFSQARKILKPGGIVAITTPTPFGNDVVHRLGAAIGLFAKSAVNDHIVIYNKKRFQILANELGFVLTKYARFELGCNQLAVLKKLAD